MAHLIPDTPLGEGGGAAAERLVFEALRDQLSDDYWVYHRFAYVGRADAKEGEVDFLVVHRTRGILFLEVKGSGVQRRADGRWARRQQDGTWKPLKRSPFEQVQDQVKDLRRELERRATAELPQAVGRGEGLRLPVGHAVAFPRASRVGAGLTPLEAPPEIFYDASDLPRLGQRVEKTMSFWRQGESGQPLSEEDFRAFRQDVLAPTLRIMPRLIDELGTAHRQLDKLTGQQAEVLHGMLGNPRLRVLGGAGTGKTVLALATAEELAQRGLDVLLLCFTKRLGDDLAAQADAANRRLAKRAKRKKQVVGRVHARHFHGLCDDASEVRDGHKLQVTGDRETVASFFREEAPVIAWEVLEAGRLPRYDAVIVDEGQDFAPSWWDVVEASLQPESERGRDSGRLYVFYDPGQSIFEHGGHVPLDMPEYQLTYNLRNTRAVAQALHHLAGERAGVPHEWSPEGREPVVRPQGQDAETVAEVGALVKRWVEEDGVRLHQIALLTPRTKRHSSLAGVNEVGGYPLTEHRSAWGRAILHSTISSFKGLEADIVVLLDIDPSHPRSDVRARYVGASRARHTLVVFSKGDWLGDVE